MLDSSDRGPLGLLIFMSWDFGGWHIWFWETYTAVCVVKPGCISGKAGYRTRLCYGFCLVLLFQLFRFAPFYFHRPNPISLVSIFGARLSVSSPSLSALSFSSLPLTSCATWSVSQTALAALEEFNMWFFSLPVWLPIIIIRFSKPSFRFETFLLGEDGGLDGHLGRFWMLSAGTLSPDS